MSSMLYKSVMMNDTTFRPKIQKTGIEYGHYKNGYKVEYEDSKNFVITIFTHAHGAIIESIKFEMVAGKLSGSWNFLLPGFYYTHKAIKNDEIKKEFSDYWSKSFVLEEHHKYFTF